MSEQEEGFAPERLDEQLEQPLENLSPAEARLVSALYEHERPTWEHSARVLEHAWERIVQNQNLPSAQIDTPERMKALAQGKKPERIFSMPEKRKNRSTLIFGTLAALLLVALVLSLVIVQHGQYLNVPGSQITGSPTVSVTPPTPTPAPVFGKTLYAVAGEWTDASWSPNSQRLVLVKDGNVQIQDALTGGNVLKIALPGGTTAANVAWSPHSEIIAVNTGQEILFVNGQTGAITGHYTPRIASVSVPGTSGPYLSRTMPASGDSPLGGLAWSPDGRFLATDQADPATGAQKILILNAQNYQVVTSLKKAGYNLDDFSFSPDGQYLAVSVSALSAPAPAGSNLTLVWKIATGQVIFSQDGGGSLAWQPGSHNLAFERFKALKGGGYEGLLVRWNVLTNRELNQYSLTGAFGGIAFSPDGLYLAYESEGETMTTNAVVVLNPFTGQSIYAYKGPDQSGYGFINGLLAWSPNGRYIVSLQQSSATSFGTTQLEVWTAV